MEGKVISSFVLDSLLGRGSFGSVWLAHPTRSQLPVAVKAIPRSSMGDTALFLREVSILRQLSHPFVCKFFEVAEDPDFHYVIQEYASGRSLGEHISSKGPLTEPQARHYFTQLVCALEYLHTTRRVVHRDIKSDNILLDDHDNVKLVDFGLSRSFVNPDDRFRTACGSPCYAAPEVVRRQSYTASVDIWSCGVVLYHMTAGHLPFVGRDIQATSKKIVKEPPEFLRTMSDSLISLLHKMLCKDPESRITLDGIKTHPWFSMQGYHSVVRFTDALAQEAAMPGLDPQVIARMEADGIGCTGLPHALLTRENNELTTLYAIYKRRRVTQQMADLIVEAQAAGIWRLEKRLSSGAVGVAQVKGRGLTKPQIMLPRTSQGAADGERGTARIVVAPLVTGTMARPSVDGFRCPRPLRLQRRETWDGTEEVVI
jgi:hypothetical protein